MVGGGQCEIHFLTLILILLEELQPICRVRSKIGREKGRKVKREKERRKEESKEGLK